MISVIVPVFNSEKTISDCIESLLSQKSPQNFEVIAVNDASTDNTKKKLETFFGKIVYIENSNNKGPAFSRNLGAKTAKGEIICFIDADCVAEKNWINEMIKPFHDKNVAAVQGAYKTKQKQLVARFAQEEIEQRYEKMRHAKNLDWVGSYSAAYRRKIFFELGGFDESFPIASGEDPDLSFRVSKKAHKIAFNEKAVVYHTHPDNLASYLKTKFFRAYYRVQLYKKHPGKLVSDSYTPFLLKLRVIGFFAGALAFLVLWFFQSSYFFPLLIFLFLFYFIVTPFSFFMTAVRKDFFVAVFSPFILFLRDLWFGAGLFIGTIKQVLK